MRVPANPLSLPLPREEGGVSALHPPSPGSGEQGAGSGGIRVPKVLASSVARGNAVHPLT